MKHWAWADGGYGRGFPEGRMTGGLKGPSDGSRPVGRFRLAGRVRDSFDFRRCLRRPMVPRQLATAAEADPARG